MVRRQFEGSAGAEVRKVSDTPRRSGVGAGRQLLVMWRVIGESDGEVICISGVAPDGVLKGSEDRPVWWERSRVRPRLPNSGEKNVK